MAEIRHRVGIRADLAAVHAALTTAEGVGGWWGAGARGDGRAGGRLEVPFPPAAPYVLEVVEATGVHVRWRVAEGPREWVGTHVDFALRQAEEYTVVLLRHEGWAEPVEFLHHCSTKWAVFLLSLRDLVETGTGQPWPDDVKIDDWDRV